MSTQQLSAQQQIAVKLNAIYGAARSATILLSKDQTTLSIEQRKLLAGPVYKLVMGAPVKEIAAKILAEARSVDDVEALALSHGLIERD